MLWVSWYIVISFYICCCGSHDILLLVFTFIVVGLMIYIVINYYIVVVVLFSSWYWVMKVGSWEVSEQTLHHKVPIVYWTNSSSVGIQMEALLLCTHVCPINTFCFAFSGPHVSLGCCSESQTHFVKRKKTHFTAQHQEGAGAIPDNTTSLSLLLKLFFYSSLKNLI
jgi:hypothetical protein